MTSIVRSKGIVERALRDPGAAGEGFIEDGWIAGLAQQQPDGGHGGCAGAEVETEVDVRPIDSEMKTGTSPRMVFCLPTCGWLGASRHF